MKIPAKVQVGGITYRVDLVSRIQVRDPDTGQMQDRWGEVDYSIGVIRIVSYVSVERQWSVFIHECLHTMFLATGIEFEDTEDVVSRLEPWLFRFMVDNGFLKVVPLAASTVSKNERRALDLRGDDAVIEGYKA